MIQVVLVMEVAYLVNVSVKQDGKVKIVVREINKFINAYQDVRIMDITIWRLARVFAIDIGRVTIVHKLFAVWIVDQMEFVSRRVVAAILVGLEHFVSN